MLWLNFLHFYQPANTEFYHIQIALNKSYWRLLRLLEEHPRLRMTWNVTGCLLDRLTETDEGQAFIKRLGSLLQEGRIELTGSAAYHGFLPLLPDQEIILQIQENEKILKKYFGQNLKLPGFFIPEMAYNQRVAKIIKKLGYSWIILDEISYSGASRRRPHWGQFYLDARSGLQVIFRDRRLSSVYPPDKLQENIQHLTTQQASLTNKIYLTATDAELYGLRHEDPSGELEKFVNLKSLSSTTISDFWRSSEQKNLEKINLFASSWETNRQEIEQGTPYCLWRDQKNKIQLDLWKLAKFALHLHDQFKTDPNFYWYRWHLVRGLASCTFWWASGRNFTKIFGPDAWSPDDIERGLEDLIRAVRSLSSPQSKSAKLQAEKYYLQIKKQIWSEHWQKHWLKVI